VDDETPLGDTDQHSDVIEASQAGRACGSPRLGAGPCLPAAGTYGKTMRLDRFLRTIDETAGIPREYAPLVSVVT
jgi:hypothetical protein